ncbi:MAG: hypothetical protein JWN45_3175 [Acidobacteriaceae bacterium]|nr:hypothetical protein [Acidobacteriaceae bacterium]
MYVSVLLDLSLDINNSALAGLWRRFPQCSCYKLFAVAHADTDSNTARANSANITYAYTRTCTYSHTDTRPYTYSHTHSHTRACRFTQADQRNFGKPAIWGTATVQREIPIVGRAECLIDKHSGRKQQWNFGRRVRRQK